jgi:hypothetical protein
MNKAIVQIGYNNYVLDTEKALKLLSLLEEAERYEHKWRKEEEGVLRTMFGTPTNLPQMACVS